MFIVRLDIDRKPMHCMRCRYMCKSGDCLLIKDSRDIPTLGMQYEKCPIEEVDEIGNAEPAG